jgi:hypothetical protein
MFFYEAALEVTMSIVLGFQYIREYDSEPGSDVYTLNPSNANTREVHRKLLYLFVGL